MSGITVIKADPGDMPELLEDTPGNARDSKRSYGERHF